MPKPLLAADTIDFEAPQSAPLEGRLEQAAFFAFAALSGVESE